MLTGNVEPPPVSVTPEPNQASKAGEPPSGRAPLWNIVAVALPGLVLAVGLLMLAGNPSGRGDYAGAMGSAVLLVLGVGAACGLGAVAALVALVRGERLRWLTVLGLIVNGIVVVPVLGLLMLV